jgi:hypothetical protein
MNRKIFSGYVLAEIWVKAEWVLGSEIRLTDSVWASGEYLVSRSTGFLFLFTL